MKTNLYSLWLSSILLIFAVALSSQTTLKYVSDKNVRTYHFPKFFLLKSIISLALLVLTLLN